MKANEFTFERKGVKSCCTAGNAISTSMDTCTAILEGVAGCLLREWDRACYVALQTLSMPGYPSCTNKTQDGSIKFFKTGFKEKVCVCQLI
jgi:hypothetical protein